MTPLPALTPERPHQPHPSKAEGTLRSDAAAPQTSASQPQAPAAPRSKDTASVRSRPDAGYRDFGAPTAPPRNRQANDPNRSIRPQHGRRRFHVDRWRRTHGRLAHLLGQQRRVFKRQALCTVRLPAGEIRSRRRQERASQGRRGRRWRGEKAPAEQFAKGVGSTAPHPATHHVPRRCHRPVAHARSTHRSGRSGSRPAHRRLHGRRWRRRRRRRGPPAVQSGGSSARRVRGPRPTTDAARAARHTTPGRATSTGQRDVAARIRREHRARRQPRLDQQDRSRSWQAWPPCRSRPPGWSATPSCRPRPPVPCNATAATPTPPSSRPAASPPHSTWAPRSTASTGSPGSTADGSIVVANSYGLAYIPDGVELPPQVTLASADESIPPTERGKWATYPILAIQGWAQAHDQTLRAVIATKEQFANFDPGVPKVVLQRDDIPETGKMQGRSRLEVIAPEPPRDSPRSATVRSRPAARRPSRFHRPRGRVGGAVVRADQAADEHLTRSWRHPPRSLRHLCRTRAGAGTSQGAQRL